MRTKSPIVKRRVPLLPATVSHSSRVTAEEDFAACDRSVRTSLKSKPKGIESTSLKTCRRTENCPQAIKQPTLPVAASLTPIGNENADHVIVPGDSGRCGIFDRTKVSEIVKEKPRPTRDVVPRIAACLLVTVPLARLLLGA